MADLVMVKRGALLKGELGLFIDSEVFQPEFDSIKQGTDVSVEAKQSRNLKQMRLAWGLCRKIADSGALGDADTREVMNYLLKKAKHVKYIANTHRDGVEVEVIVKSIRFASMEQTAFDRLFNRMIYIVTSEIIPDMPVNELRAEVEKMSGVTAPEPTKPKPRRRPAGSAIEKVSVIPPADHDPVTGEVHEPPAETFPGDTPMKPAGDAPAPTPAKREETATPQKTEAPPAAPAAVTQVSQATPVVPKTATEWAAYATAWIEAMVKDAGQTDQEMMVMWNGERSLRNACGVTAVERQPVFEVYTAALDHKRKVR